LNSQAIEHVGEAICQSVKIAIRDVLDASLFTKPPKCNLFASGSHGMANYRFMSDVETKIARQTTQLSTRRCPRKCPRGFGIIEQVGSDAKGGMRFDDRVAGHDTNRSSFDGALGHKCAAPFMATNEEQPI
jgi:hypothetical protein